MIPAANKGESPDESAIRKNLPLFFPIASKDDSKEGPEAASTMAVVPFFML